MGSKVINWLLGVTGAAGSRWAMGPRVGVGPWGIVLNGTSVYYSCTARQVEQLTH